MIGAAFYPKDVIVRLSDFKSNESSNLIGGHLYEPHEENPMLGFRGASRYISPEFYECFQMECQALKRVRDGMALTNLEIMVPFVRTLTEAAQSLGAGWFTIIFRIIFPNLRTALLSGTFLTFAIVLGEYTIASFLARPMFGPYLANMVRNKAYEPAALSIISFALTWAMMGGLQWVTHRTPGSTQVTTGPR